QINGFYGFNRQTIYSDDDFSLHRAGGYSLKTRAVQSAHPFSHPGLYGGFFTGGRLYEGINTFCQLYHFTVIFSEVDTQIPLKSILKPDRGSCEHKLYALVFDLAGIDNP